MSMKFLPIFLREIITNSLTLLPNQISRFIREVVQQGQAKKKSATGIPAAD
jgi:hypothetical protein